MGIYASGKHSIAECDRCGKQVKLKELKTIVLKTKDTNLHVCKECWEPDQPQLSLGLYPVFDPQAVENPRPDTTYLQSGLTGLQLQPRGPAASASVLAFGTPGGGSRVIQWGWNPVGLYNPLQLSGLVDVMQMAGSVGTVTVVIT